MENGPFIDDFPIKTSIYKGFSMAMLNSQMIYIYIHTYLDVDSNMENALPCDRGKLENPRTFGDFESSSPTMK